jgi:Skp family chaperone for outer membrane proteins
LRTSENFQGGDFHAATFYRMEHSMKTRNIRLICLLALALFAFGCNGQTAPSVAVVNTDKVYKESDPSKAGMSYLEDLSTKLQTELTDLQKKMESNTKKKDAQAAFQQALMELQQRFSAEQQQVISTLNETYMKALENSRNKYKVQVIIPSDATLSVSPEADFTDKVITEMNAVPTSFKPLGKDEAAPANTQ